MTVLWGLIILGTTGPSRDIHWYYSTWKMSNLLLFSDFLSVFLQGWAQKIKVVNLKSTNKSGYSPQ